MDVSPVSRAIVNVACGFWYPNGQQRLADSLDAVYESAARMFWRDELPPGCPPLMRVPYAFKVYALLAARDAGFQQVLWIDASCWAIRSLDPVWEQLDALGYYLEPDGHHIGEWVSDDALQELGETRDSIWGWPLPEGKLIGVDFDRSDAHAWLMDVEAHLDAFRGPWSNANEEASPDPRCRGHRHDIAVGGILAPRHGLAIAGPKRVAFPDPDPTVYDMPERVVLMSEGMASW